MPQRPTCELCPNRMPTGSLRESFKRSRAPKLSSEECPGPRFVLRTAVEFNTDHLEAQGSLTGAQIECSRDALVVAEGEHPGLTIGNLVIVFTGEVAVQEQVINEVMGDDDSFSRPGPSLPVITRPKGSESDNGSSTE